MKNKMMKTVLGVVMSAMMIAGLAGCGKADVATEPATNEAVEVETTVIVQDEAAVVVESAVEEADEVVADEMPDPDWDFPDNFLEERTGKYSFDSYDEIISLLEDGEAYAYVNIMGSDDEILLITEATFDGYGFPATIDAYPYLLCESGKYECGSVLSSSSTSTPITITEDGLVLTASHSDISLSAIDKDTKGIMLVEYAYVEYGENDNNTYGGFVRETNSVYSEEKEIAADSSEEFESAFALYDTNSPVEFTVVSK